jgi:hypothetical protein
MLKTSMKSTITAITGAVGFEQKPCIQLLPAAVGYQSNCTRLE